MKMKRHKKLKAAAALILCAFIVLSGMNTETAFAANKKIPLKVKFNGVTVNLVKNLRSIEDDNSPALSSLKKKWGAPKTDKYGEGEDAYSTYTWKKGKTTIEVSDWDSSGKNRHIITGVGFTIKDKNAAVWGVKVGMKKDTALKKIKKALGTDKVSKTAGDGEFVGIVENKKSIEAYTGFYMPVTFELKNGKVTCIYFTKS